ncbi:MAG: shikimate dehydrogenase [Pseudomonadota bacterium]|nr:shikimate dehydrogenase [Pseudomonadota bacterium]
MPSDAKQFAVIGQPVAHSLSPRIHARFSRQTGIALDYRAIEAGPGDFAELLAAFAAEGGAGANITLPHKERAAAICDSLGDRARRSGAANTLIRTGNGWHGDNTDGIGLVRDLTGRCGMDLRSRRVLMIGAGGAARGVAPALLDARIGDLFVVNRNSARADQLSDLLGEPDRVHVRYLDDVGSLGAFDLIINATSAARGSEGLALPGSLVAPRADVVDLSYGEVAIPFLAWARAAGADKIIDGLGMLVEQAAESFLLWHGVRPDTDEVYEQLRSHSASLATGD